MSEPAHDDELAALQAALARLTPTPDGINLARLLFRAGQLSAPRRSWVWPCATATSIMLAATLGSMLLFRPIPQPAERVVQVFIQPPTPPPPRPEPPAPSTGETLVPPSQPGVPADTERPLDGSDYLRLRREVLANGLDALPPPAPWPAVLPADDAEPLLDLPHGSREPWFIHLKRSLKPGDAS
ncbi:MAG TPA: hypothetical protein VH682_05425 [Gemmataceae bacterium]|jgi:hypothetical protein